MAGKLSDIKYIYYVYIHINIYVHIDSNELKCTVIQTHTFNTTFPQADIMAGKLSDIKAFQHTQDPVDEEGESVTGNASNRYT